MRNALYPPSILISALIFLTPVQGEAQPSHLEHPNINEILGKYGTDSLPMDPAEPSREGSPAETAEPSSAPEGEETAETPGEAGSQEVEKALETPEEAKRPAASTEAEAAQVLSGESRLQLEITETYAHFSSNQLFIDGFSIVPILVVGDIDIQRIRRDIFITTLTVRYKLITDLQIEFRVPFQYTFTRTSTATGTTSDGTLSPNTETIAAGGGMGDVETSLSYQVSRERVGWPSLLVGLGVKGRTGRDFFETTDPASNPPTGSGYNSLIGTMSLVKVSDPAVVFGSFSYVYAQPRKDVVFRPKNQPPRLIRYSPGDSIRFGMGMAYALNYRLTLSLQYQQALTFPTRIDGKKSPNSFANSVSMRIGGVWRVNDKVSFDLGVSPGLTLDAPDFRLDLRVPYRF